MEEPRAALTSIAKSEFLCNLQFPDGSPLSLALRELREACRTELGTDATYLFPPHVSVTGFFTATAEQLGCFCQAARTLVSVCANSLCVDIRSIVSTQDGYVLFDISAPGVSELASTLTTMSDLFGLFVRAKAVRHLSLASTRTLAEQKRIVEIYAGLPLGQCTMELVVSQCMQRSDSEMMRNQGSPHIFQELMRLPLCKDGRSEVQPLVCGNIHADTPLRRRPDAIAASSICDVSSNDVCTEAQITPLKRSKVNDEAEITSSDTTPVKNARISSHDLVEATDRSLSDGAHDSGFDKQGGSTLLLGSRVDVPELAAA